MNVAHVFCAAFVLASLATAHAAPPGNDSFTGAPPILAGVAATGTNVDATAEPDEPAHAGQPAAASVWWTFVPEASGPFEIETVGSSFDTRLAIYTGDDLGSLVLVAENDDINPANEQSRVGIQAIAGATYHVAVDGFGGARGRIRLSVFRTLQEPNDDFAGRIDLGEVTGFAISANNQGATAEPNEPVSLGQLPNASLWWTWTAPSAGTVTIDTVGSGIDTTLSVFTGSALDALTEVAANDDADGLGTQSRVVFSARAGTEYQIRVDGFGGEQGDLTLTLQLGDPAAAPENDDFENAEVLPAIVARQGAGAAFEATNVNATVEAGEPAHAGQAARSSVWWNWTPLASGLADIRTSGSNFDTVLAVYAGDALSGLSPIAANDDLHPDTLQSGVTFEAVAGVTYRIAVDGFEGGSGLIALTLTQAAVAPANDAFSQARDLGNRITVSDSAITVGATAQAGEPAHAGQTVAASLWWKWRAPAHGSVVVDTTESGFDTVLAVYSGDAVSALAPVASNDDESAEVRTSRVIFNAIGGTVYFIAVDGRAGAVGAAALNLAFTVAPPEPPANDGFTDAQVLAAGAMSGGGPLAGGTAQAGEPPHGGAPAMHSAWFRWTASRDSRVILEAEGSADLRAAVYTGTSLESLNLVVESALPGGTQALSFFATEGVEYQIAFDGSGNAVAFLLSFLGPLNDDFADAIVLGSTTDVSAIGFNYSATAETNEPAHDGAAAAASVWWRWVAPADGIATVSIAESALDPRVAVYAGDALEELTALGSGSATLGGEAQASFPAVAGTTYAIAVDGAGGSEGDIALRIVVGSGPVNPPNDHFADAEDLGSESSVTAAGNNVNASAEIDEPEHGDQAPIASIWWKWTAPETRIFTADTLTSELDTVLAVYTGTALRTLRRIASNDDADAAHLQSAATFPAVAGTVYYFAVDGFGGATAPIDFRISPGFGPLAPENDDFENAMDLESDPLLTVEGTNLHATAQAGEPSHAGAFPRASVWWKWTAGVSATVTVDTFGSAPDTVLAVYSGPSLSALSAIQSNDDADGSTLQSAVTFAALSGVDYYFAVDGFGGEMGSLILNLNTSAPDNDRFANAANLGSSIDIRLSVNNSGATAEESEPAHAGRPAAHTLWWKWTAPADINVAIDTLGSEIDTVLAVYAGASLNALVQVASNDNAQAGDVSSRLVFRASAGTVYRIALGSAEAGEVGPVALTLRETVVINRPTNDDFANAIALASAPAVNTVGDNANATAEQGEPAHADIRASRSVWWNWTAPASGRLTIDTLGSTADTVLAIYTGAEVRTLTPIAANDDASASTVQSRVALQVIAGVTYRIAVDSFGGSTGSLRLQLRLENGRSPAEAYRSWEMESFPPATAASERAPNGDFDRDGIANAIEYLMQLDPVRPGTSALRITRVPGATVLTYSRRRDAPAAFETIQATSDLASWSTLDDSQVNVVLIGQGAQAPDIMQITIPDTLGFRFFRLAVATTP